jgi:hypothetical protein
MWVINKKLFDEAGDDGAAAGSADATVLTGDTGADDKSTVLTGDAGADKDSNSGAAASDDDTGATDDKGDGEAGSEGSQDKSPETYADFVLPEGQELDETALAEANPMFKEMGLNQEQAQTLVDFYAKHIQAGFQAQTDAFNQLMSDWRGQSENDNEFGGDKYKENVKIAQSAISKYGTPELKQLLLDHGMGNHPEVIRFMVRVGHTLKEDVPDNSGHHPTTPADRISILYPTKE